LAQSEDVTDPVDTNYTESHQFHSITKKDLTSASRTQSSIEAELDLMDRENGVGRSEDGSSYPHGELIQTWEWDGGGEGEPAPGCTFTVGYRGHGNVSATGSATVTAGGGYSPTSAASADGASMGTGTGTGAQSVSAQVSGVGGSVTHNSTGSLSGSASVSPRGEAGISGTVATGTTGTGSFSRTGQWAIRIYYSGDVPEGGDTFCVETFHSCSHAMDVAADGMNTYIWPLGYYYYPGNADADMDASAYMNANVTNIILKEDH
jgi:hypothetical protein